MTKTRALLCLAFVALAWSEDMLDRPRTRDVMMMDMTHHRQQDTEVEAHQDPDPEPPEGEDWLGRMTVGLGGQRLGSSKLFNHGYLNAMSQDQCKVQAWFFIPVNIIHASLVLVPSPWTKKYPLEIQCGLGLRSSTMAWFGDNQEYPENLRQREVYIINYIAPCMPRGQRNRSYAEFTVGIPSVYCTGDQRRFIAGLNAWMIAFTIA